MPGRGGSTNLVFSWRYEGTSLKLRGWEGLDTRTSRSPGGTQTQSLASGPSYVTFCQSIVLHYILLLWVLSSWWFIFFCFLTSRPKDSGFGRGGTGFRPGFKMVSMIATEGRGWPIWGCCLARNTRRGCYFNLARGGGIGRGRFKKVLYREERRGGGGWFASHCSWVWAGMSQTQAITAWCLSREAEETEPKSVTVFWGLEKL